MSAIKWLATKDSERAGVRAWVRENSIPSIQKSTLKLLHLISRRSQKYAFPHL